jgi:Ni/Co efflux regulator RcnB
MAGLEGPARQLLTDEPHLVTILCVLIAHLRRADTPGAHDAVLDKPSWETEMKSRSLVCIATIAAFGFGTAAQAQQWRGGEGHDQRQEQRQQARAERHVQAQPQAQVQQHWQQRQQVQQSHQQWQAPAYQQHYAQPRYNQQYQARAYNNYAPRSYAYGGNYGAQQYRAYGNYGHYGNYGSHYYVGGYAPSYASHRYWINDWRARNLYAPPYGYQWVQTDTGDVLLLALATGLIANAIMAQ